MSLIPWKPMSDLEKIFDKDEWFLPVLSGPQFLKPAMDVYETNNDIVAEIDLPGFDSKNINISIENNVLRITGKIDEKKETEEKGYWHKEIKKESFERAFRLPSPVKENLIEATYKKGVLKIVMPKAETNKTPKVQIKVKEK